MTSAEAEIYVSAQDPYKGSSQYYQRISKRYAAPDIDGNVTGNQKKNPLVPIVCINLLRYGEGKSESILVQHFVESVNYIKSSGKLPNTRIHLANYDWHASTKLKGEQQTIEGLWKLLKGPTVNIEMCEGDYLPSRMRLNDCKGEIICTDGIEGAFVLRSHQNGVIRFNCADSLDRTNAASYFGALQVFVEQCRRLGVSLDTDLAYGYSSSNNYGGYIAPLPRGWEKRSDAVTGKSYFIDHNTRTTTWVHPCPDKPWKRFDMSFDEFKRSTILSPISQLSEIFLLAGDIHATLYTGSKAMHSQILNIFTEETGKFKQFSVAQNVKITLQRRYKNVLVDGSRQKQLEMFLGMRLFRHIPSMSIHPLQVLSRPAACFLKPVANMIPSSSGGALLSFKKKDVIWVCTQAADVLELFIYLSEPCHVCQLLLTVSHGADDSTYPASVDVKTGRDLDGLKLVLEGASIPRCPNGTSLLLPLAGAVKPEDMAVTGAGTRLHAQETPNLPLLYDFEELEGELDFLTRVVALTFYPGVTGKAPLTLGEIEVLGVSLPWRGIFTKDGPGLKFNEIPDKFQKDTKPSQVSSDTNPFANASVTNGNYFSSAPSSASGNHAVDLLTGDFGSSEPIFQPEIPDSIGNVESDAGDLLDFLDHAVTYDKGVEGDSEPSFSPQDGKHITDNGVQHYIDCFKALFGPHMPKNIDFEDAMKLEIERLRMNLSAAERDRALLSVGTDPASIDPNRLLDASYMARLCKVANNLALLGQAALEDKVNASVGRQEFSGDVTDDAIDFWNITGIEETCSGNKCEVRAVNPPRAQGASSLSPMFICSQCERKVCKVCCAGKGALLLGSRIGQGDGVSTNNTTILDGVICKSCCNEIVLDALVLDYVRVLISTRRNSRADTAAYAALDQVIPHAHLPDHNSTQPSATKILKNILSGGESLAEFPFASLLHPVETALGSAPPMSLLAPLYVGSQDSYWRSPPSMSSVEFSIVLSSLSDVSGVVLLVSSCGYSTFDTPTVQIWASNTENKEERTCTGKWDIETLIRSNPDYYGPEKANQGPRHVKFTFRNPVRCRIIWVSLRLQKPGSSSVHLEKAVSLLSLDEEDINPFAQVNRRASFSASTHPDPYLHARRLLVVGSSAREDVGLGSPQGSDQISINRWLERVPQLNRFKVPIEVERMMDEDRVVEQYLLPASPDVTGFRIDAFSAIKPRVTHSPPSNASIWDDSLTWLEDRHIYPAVLFIQVSALQEPNNVYTVGEYRLPVARAGTPMYFDFPRPVQARRITFKLLGDVAAFADDTSSEQDNTDNRAPLPPGLNLINRFKLYYYADPYDLGKWASLSAV
ncbi:putative phosphoinositide phosphatase sac9 [Ranunculus cassubicifolius]